MGGRPFNLSAVKHVFKESVVQIDCGQEIKLSRVFVTEVLDDFLQESLDEVKVINEDLEQVLNLDFLVCFKSVCWVLLFEIPFVFGVDDKSFSDVNNNLVDPLRLVSPSESVIRATTGVIFLLKKFWDVLLEALHFLFEVINLLVNKIKSSCVVMSVLNFNLDKQLKVVALLSKSLSLVKSLFLLPAHLNSRVNIKNRFPIVLGLRFLDQFRNLVLLLHLYIAI